MYLSIATELNTVFPVSLVNGPAKFICNSSLGDEIVESEFD